MLATSIINFSLMVLMYLKKTGLLFSLILFLMPVCTGQTSSDGTSLLLKLDSISQSPSISKHFAKLYYNTTVVADNFFASADEPVRSFMKRLENRFGEYFFEAAQSYKYGTSIPENWSAYFSDTGFSEAQYFLLGANAHINGDIWQALTSEFSLKEILDNKEPYFNFYKSLKKIYSDVYYTTIISAKKAELLHNISLGFDKVYGKLMLRRWRKRQMKLAILYFTDKRRFERKLDKLKRKMAKLDRLICKNLH